MSMFSDWEADHAFEIDYPHGVPCEYWTDRNGCKHKVTEMDETYIRNCMRFVGEDDAWYQAFQKELNRRAHNDSTV